MSRGDLSEAEWCLLEPLLPPEQGRKNRPAFDKRQIVNGILWRIRTGAPWRDLPEKYGKWMTVYQRFRRWSEAGIWVAVAKARPGLDWALLRADGASGSSHRRVQCHGGANERLQRLFINLVALTEIDGTPGVAFEAGVEEA